MITFLNKYLNVLTLSSDIGPLRILYQRNTAALLQLFCTCIINIMYICFTIFLLKISTSTSIWRNQAIDRCERPIVSYCDCIFRSVPLRSISE